METKTKKNLIIWGIILLVLLNVSSLGTIWYHRYQFNKNIHEKVVRDNARRSPASRERQQGPPSFLIKDLSLSDDQMQEFSSIWAKHGIQRRELEVKMDENRTAMGEILSKPQLDSAAFLRISARQIVLMQELDYAMLDMNRELRSILNEEQLERFLGRLDRLNKRMRNRSNRPSQNNK